MAMPMQKRKAQRRQVKPKVGLAGSSGGGKTYSSLRMAYGYTGDWSKICLIDTEAGRGELYANTTIKGIHIGEYDYIRLDPPFEPRRYIEAIRMAEADPNIEAIILDSLSHGWAGSGGMLDMKDAYSKNSNENSFTAWRKVTPEHNNLVDTILRSRCAIFATVRSKTEYVIEDVNGKKVPRKIGMAPVFRDGLEYEFTVFMEMSQDHYANASKDNTGIFEGVPFTPTDEHGKALRNWLETGTGEPITPPPIKPPAPPRNRPPANGNGASMDIDKARAAFFASINELANRIGIENKYATNYAKEILYKKFSVDSLTKLGQEQWAAVKANQDKIMALMEKAFLKILSEEPEAPPVPPEGAATAVQGEFQGFAPEDIPNLQ